MIYFKVLLFAFLGFPFCWTTDGFSESPQKIKATAYSDFANKKVAYFEEHRAFFGPSGIMRSENDYFDKNRKKIAELVSDYSRNKYMPTYIFRDIRSGHEEGLKFSDGNYFVFYQNRNSKIEEKIIKPELSTFSCQGWHYFILENMERLEKEGVHLNLIFPNKLDEYRFSLKKVAEKGNVIKIRLEFDNWFIKIFAPHLELTYDSKTRKILSFVGPSNIPDEEGNTQNVTVVYES
ncbi:MAG: hypothetical protein KA436_08335 [Oligoflexales bacterium]|nr:hypothetical protein [Oligoflexales bacterium]